jgi:hypothetical protein
VSPRSLPSLLPLTLVVTLAAWCSRGVLDVVAGPNGPVRVAMLPPPAVLVVSALLALGGQAAWLVGATRIARRRLRAGPHLDGKRVVAPVSVLVPLYVTGVLITPYLPVLPDLVPWLRVFAGPVAGIVWAVAGVAVIVATAAFLGASAPRADDGGGSFWRSRIAPAVVWVVTLAVLVPLSWRLTKTPQIPGGDEPHYLVIAQSLWRDGDMKIENNHARGDYREYFDRPLDPHYLTRGRDEAIYSIHPIGLPVLIAPVYALGGYRLVVLALVMAGALAAALMWAFTRDVTGEPGAAAFSWLAIAFSVPFVLNSMSVYPEIVGAACVVVAISTGWVRGGRRDTPGRWWAAGFAVAALPWLATKYALMAGALGVVLAGRACLWNGTPGERPWQGRRPRLVAALAPSIVGLAAWLAFFQWVWGTPWPSAPYGTLTQTTVLNLPAGALGLLFDQEYGVVIFAPALLLAAPGWWRMWRAGGAVRRLAIEVTVVFLALLAMVGAFRIWWGDASPGRPVIAGLLLWAVPVSWYVAPFSDDRRAGARAWATVLLFAGLVLTTVTASVQAGALVASVRDGASRLLQWLGGTVELWRALPSFIAHPVALAGLMTLAWLGAFCLTTWLVSRDWIAGERTATRLRAGEDLLLALAALVALAFLGSASVLAAFRPQLQGSVPIDARSRSVLLDGYSTTARPVAIRYEPFSATTPADVASAVRFRAAPGVWRDPQPVPLLLNMRLSLPAGRYRVALQFAPLPAGEHVLALRVGRVGPHFEVFTVAGTGSTWQAEFELPVDANFVGFEASRALAGAVQRAEVVPLRVVDRGRRARIGQVLAAQRYPVAAVFSHDEDSWLEKAGVWTAAQREAAFTMIPAASGVLALRLRAGTPNVVTLASGGWQARVEVAPDAPAEVAVPGVEAGTALPLLVRTTTGHVPIDRDPAVRDRRFLGVFLEMSARPTP